MPAIYDLLMFRYIYIIGSPLGLTKFVVITFKDVVVQEKFTDEPGVTFSKLNLTNLAYCIERRDKVKMQLFYRKLTSMNLRTLVKESPILHVMCEIRNNR